jgi:hypothetical protein
MQWEEKLFWISRGFRTTITIEIACPAHGLYGAELTQEQEYYACPACASPCRATIICEGITRRVQLNPSWELVSRPLERHLKIWLLRSPDELVKPRKKKPKKPLLRRGWRPNSLRPLWR